jgi:hypothetical protein
VDYQLAQQQAQTDSSKGYYSHRDPVGLCYNTVIRAAYSLPAEFLTTKHMNSRNQH